MYSLGGIIANMKRKDTATGKFCDGYNCAQAVFYSFCDKLNLDKNIALKISSGFGAGMGLKEEVCGAVTGGIMVLGMLYGRGNNEELPLTEKTYQKTREFMDQFEMERGSYICSKLLQGCDLTTTEGKKEFKEKDLKNKVCQKCVREAVRIIENMIS